MKKFNYFFDDEKEEQWINEMAQQGWHLKNHQIIYYIFEKGEPGEYTYRCDLLDSLGYGKAAADYIEFVESTGAELVYKKLHWAYFRQHRDLGAFELYSDATSKINFVNRVLTLYTVIAVMSLLLAIANGAVRHLEQATHFNSFFSGVGTGAFLTMLIPITLLMMRKRNLKKKMALHEV